MKKHLALTTALILATLAGCGGSSSRSSSPTGTTAGGATTAPTTTATPTQSPTPTPPPPAGPTWDVLYASGRNGDDVRALMPMPNNELLVAESSGSVLRLDANGQPTYETFSNTKSCVTRLVFAEGQIYMGTVVPGYTTSDIMVRGGLGTWASDYTHPYGTLALASLRVGARAADLYATHYGAQGGASISYRPSNLVPAPVGFTQGTWQSSGVVLGRGIRLQAGSMFNGEVYLGGSSGFGGDARLYRGNLRVASTLTQVTLRTALVGSTDSVEDLFVVRNNGVDELYVAYKTVAGSPALTIGGGVLKTTDGVTFTEVGVHVNDAPARLAWHGNTLFVGLHSGGVEFLDAAGQLVPDTGVLANAGVTSLLSLDAATLLVGVEGITGAEVFRRR